jgi:hypothetical protein
MLKNLYFLVQLTRIIIEGELLNMVSTLDSSAIDIVEKSGVTLHCDHLSQIIEMDASLTIGNHEAHPVFRRVIDPFLYEDVGFLRLLHDFFEFVFKALVTDDARACRFGFYYHYRAVSFERFVAEEGLESVLAFLSVHWRLTASLTVSFRRAVSNF